MANYLIKIGLACLFLPMVFCAEMLAQRTAAAARQQSSLNILSRSRASSWPITGQSAHASDFHLTEAQTSAARCTAGYYNTESTRLAQEKADACCSLQQKQLSLETLRAQEVTCGCCCGNYNEIQMALIHARDDVEFLENRIENLEEQILHLHNWCSDHSLGHDTSTGCEAALTQCS
mmetsp:Transcript_75565/g.142548  ORF Transcript_75565/g.142548 Transcript_75565/m.142548 type:complete len:177 (+) Transcript_75565:71-601(+)